MFPFFFLYKAQENSACFCWCDAVVTSKFYFVCQNVTSNVKLFSQKSISLKKIGEGQKSFDHQRYNDNWIGLSTLTCTAYLHHCTLRLSFLIVDIKTWCPVSKFDTSNLKMLVTVWWLEMALPGVHFPNTNTWPHMIHWQILIWWYKTAFLSMGSIIDGSIHNNPSRVRCVHVSKTKPVEF